MDNLDIEEGFIDDLLKKRDARRETKFYGHRDKDELDSRLLFRGLRQHLSDKDNYYNAIDAANKHKRIHPMDTEFQSMRINLRDLSIPGILKKKYKNLTISLGSKAEIPEAHAVYHHNDVRKTGDSVFDRRLEKELGPQIRNPRIHIAGLDSLDRIDHSPNSHKDFIRELNNGINYVSMRHELLHHSDFSVNKEINFDTIRKEKQELEDKKVNSYFNSAHELRAHLFHKKHEIERSLIHNNTDFHDNPNVYDTGKNLPLRQRLHHYSDFRNKLIVIDRHSNNTEYHTPWYDKLTDENKKHAERYLGSVINKYIIPNKV